ncbi:MAG: transglutaminase-like domain-containing protein, partial [Oscillospiraceae bacterium]|nr:transglutaminase-like domain-containing protein [Oscillospiraceae bacterium]
AGGLVAFWCGMAAVQFAAGKINRNPKELSGFLLRRHVFLSLRDLKYLLPEKAGIFSALTVFVLCLTGEWILQAAHYERPEKIKNMRTDFQYYAASIDWKDVRTILPFLKDKNGDEPDEIVELGRNERREFDNRVVSQISLDAMPLGRVYLKFATYQNYRKSCWRAVEESVRTDPMMQQFEETGFYPPEFLGYAVQSLAYQTARLKLTEPNAPLSRCIPYGFLKDDAVTCHGDLVTDTNTNQYRIFAGENYENLLLRTVSYDVPAVSQLEASPAKMQEALRSALSGHEDTLVQFPQDPSMGSVYYGTEDEMQYRAAAAVLSAAGYTDLAYDAYTTLPDGVCTEYIHKMFGDLTDGFDARNATPAEKMLLLSRLRDRLCANVEYSLSPGKTPPGEDYVLYFLAENRRGYCTHYATTGTLLARLAGIPARYCEGYLVDNTKLHAEPAEDGYRYSGKILDSNAHAWTEIYIDGFGWIPYEFTFSYFTPPELPQETEPVTEPEPMTQDPTEAVIVTEIVTEYVPVTAEPTAAPSEVSAPAEIPDRLRDILGVIALAGGLTGLVLLIAARRRRVLSARELRLSDPIGDAAASYAWSLILHRLTECGVNVQAGSTDALLEEMLEKCSHLLTDEELTVLLSIGTRLRYSPHHLKAAERDTVIALYRKLTEQIYFQADPVRKLWLKWVRNYL